MILHDILSIGSRKMRRSVESDINRILINESEVLFRYASGFYDFTSLQISDIPTIVGIGYFLYRVVYIDMIFKLGISLMFFYRMHWQIIADLSISAIRGQGFNGP